MWGLVPLFWPLLKPSGAVEILAHRMVWSLAVVGIALLALRRWAWIGELVRQPRRLGLITVAAAVITVNWGVYIWAVNSGHVVEASLGYFINPLVTIAWACCCSSERLRPVQWAAVGIGVAAVLVLAVGYGRPPWISLTLAFSFATYGLVKKKVNMGGVESLAAETARAVPARARLSAVAGRAAATRPSRPRAPGTRRCSPRPGIVTAVPLVCFGAAAIRVPLSTLGLLQYLAPVFQFVLGILYFHEAMPPERWAGFALVWLALTLLTWDALRTARRTRTQAAQLAASAQPPSQSSAPASSRREFFPVRGPRAVIGAPAPPVGRIAVARAACDARATMADNQI